MFQNASERSCHRERKQSSFAHGTPLKGSRALDSKFNTSNQMKRVTKSYGDSRRKLPGDSGIE
jgi:hypothetical protein